MLATFGMLGWGVNATYDTMHRMRGEVRATYGLPIVRMTAVDIARRAGGGPEQHAVGIFSWLRRKIRFLRDPHELEALHAPPLVLATIAERGSALVDCDDVAMLGAALGMAIGFPARFVAIGKGGEFEHVFAELMAPGGAGWFDLDIQRRGAALPADLTDAIALEV